jgi:glycosyltransferase involved in cell wall biosynthesis
MNAVGEAGGTPAVSVIVTCFNLGRYLDETVQSIVSQSFRSFELVIVDDGSTEALTLQRLATLEQQGIRVIRSANRGLPAARNLGIAHTRARYICSVDADDVLEPTLLERSVDVLERDSSIAFASHWLRAFGDEAWDWMPARCDFPALLDTNTVNGAALVRRDVYVAVGGFDETMRDGCEDWDFWIAVVERGFRGHIIPEFLFRYRRRLESMSRVMLAGDTHPQLYRRLAEKHQETFRRHLPDLLLRRERDLAHLSRQNLDLELEQTRWLAPELAKQRDDVMVLERRVERRRRWQSMAGDVARLQGTLADAEARHHVARQEAEHTIAGLRGSIAAIESVLAQTASALAETDAKRRAAEHAVEETQAVVQNRSGALDVAVRRAYELDARVHRAEAALAGVQSSWSWRLTTPLRAIARLFGRSERRDS